ncbi:hypothetical protein [Actinokineospora sp.]|uniref:hypothetical protein n=1 Tax=Actinokineospora sp. TaxID=1872133 RepID=UPI0040383367
MRLLRLGDNTATVGTDLRAALASWGRGDAIRGGVALLGVQPPDCPNPVEAIVLLPRGILVVAGVDLPDPAVRLDAPLSGQWKTDGWPLVRPDGAVNPAGDAVAATSAITARLQAERVEPLPIGTVIAVGPYVSQVSQPTADLVRGVRILHPEPGTLLTAARELATHGRACTVEQVRQVLAVLHPDGPEIDTADLVAEGFAATGRAAETTAFIPRGALTPAAPVRESGKLRWLPIAAALLVLLLLIAGIAVAIGSTDDSPAPRTDGAGSAAIPIDGVSFAAKGSVEHADCAPYAYGDVQAWLTTNGCARLIRARFEATSDGKQAAVLVAVLRFNKSVSATEMRAVADKPGAGGVADQAVEGVAWPGEHRPAFESAAYASGREGNSVKLVQVVWLGQPSTPDDPALRGIATRALQITLAS